MIWFNFKYHSQVPLKFHSNIFDLHPYKKVTQTLTLIVIKAPPDEK